MVKAPASRSASEGAHTVGRHCVEATRRRDLDRVCRSLTCLSAGVRAAHVVPAATLCTRPGMRVLLLSQRTPELVPASRELHVTV